MPTEQQEKMDAAAMEASRELKGFDPETVKKMAEWWKKYYGSAGHKRLAHALLKTLKDD